MSNCTDCIIDLTDACPRGSGRAIDDEICDSFIPRETYQVNKNESWQLGYRQGELAEYNRIIGFLKYHRYAIVDNNGDYYSIEELEEMMKGWKNE